MNKIGIKITKISNGVQELETFNGGDWTLKVTDIRTDLKLLSGKALDDGSPVLMLSFTSKGALLTLCHAIPGRGGDLVSAWIFIPAEIILSADEMCSILERVNVEISKPQVEDWKAIEELFAKEYPQKQHPFSYRESVSSNPCAVRYYGAGTDFGLKELLGAVLYQDYYTGHRFVFLLDKTVGILANDKLTDYTDAPLREIVMAIPPQLPSSVMAKLNDRDFSKALLGYKGERATIVFERAGYVPIAYQIMIGGPMPNPADFSWQRHVTPSYFYVTDNENKDLNSSCHIMVNGQKLTAAGINIPEEECKAVKVEVQNSGCEPYSNTFNLMQKLPLLIVLEKEKRDIIYLLDGKECSGLTACPRGYDCTETVRGKKIYRNCVYVEPKSGGNWRLIAIIGSVVALIIGIALGFVLHKIMENHNPEEPTPKTEVLSDNAKPNKIQKKVDNKQEEKTQSKVYDCLNTNTWKKEEIDKVPELKGLFEDVVKCKADKLTKEWTEKIDPDTHPQWAELVNEIKKYDPSQLKDFQLNNNTKDVSISTYKKLLQNHVQTNQKPASGNKPKKDNTAGQSGNQQKNQSDV